MLIKDIARSALAAVDSTAGLVLCAQWVSERYRQFVRRGHLRSLRTVEHLYLPAPLTTGAMSIVAGSAVVTPNAAAITALGHATDYTDHYIRFAPGTTWYAVQSWNGAVLRLTSAVTETTATAAGYTMLKRYHDLPENIRWATSFVHDRFFRELRQRTTEEMNLFWPSRILVGPPPVSYAEAPRSLAGRKRVEFYPYMTTAETVHYIAWAIPPVLGYDDEIPSEIDTEMLKEGVLIDIYRWEAAKALRSGQADVAATLGNYARQQATQWYGRDVPEAVAAERAMDDIQMILETAGGQTRGPGRDIMSARDQVWLGQL